MCVCKASGSPGLATGLFAERAKRKAGVLVQVRLGGRAVVAGTIGALLAGALQPDRSRVRIFSPFGLGVLDMAVARFVYEQALAEGTATAIDDFFASD